eukprot:NODE_1810_length_753_cov_804.056818_g1125_i1.p2 GENE.NODE_1810_length_753_cov_804.056818_g1125_i1~~NODE_1810_length_753_cov_804.056818_g1125_i1.p2  ORF type:complete len:146 (+),score=56.88 NODE_1810_length_753_cov_804.056818_g1125_i1:27-440(+)
MGVHTWGHPSGVRSTMVKDKKGKKSGLAETVALETTVNIAKPLKGITFKKRAPRAVSLIRKVAERMLKTPDVRIDVKLNKFLWSQGIRNPPRRVRVKMERKRSEDEDAEHKLFTVVSLVPVTNFTGLLTKVDDSVEE